MRVSWLQHADFEDAGCIGPWLFANGHSARGVLTYTGEPLPELSAFDVLIILGGPMNIYEDAAHPWLVAEKVLIRDAIAAGKRVLGICLGSQLIADVLGLPTMEGKPAVTRNPQSEIGWFPLALTPAGRAHPVFAGLPESFTGFHWHGDTWTLPPDALLLAGSAACANQAFSWDGSRVLGLQFHLEAIRTNVREWFRYETVIPSAFVQTPEQILADDEAFANNNRWMLAILERFFAD